LTRASSASPGPRDAGGGRARRAVEARARTSRRTSDGATIAAVRLNSPLPDLKFSGGRAQPWNGARFGVACDTIAPEYAHRPALPFTDLSTEPPAVPTLFDTDDAPPGQRFARWRETASELFVPVDLASPSPDTFRYRSWRSTIGGMDLGTSVAREFQVRHNAAHIARSTRDPISLYIPTHGEIAIAQNGRDVRVRPGEFVAVDQDRPYEMAIHREFGFVWMHIPRESLGHRLEDLGAIGGARFSTRNPYASLAANFVGQVARVGEQVGPGHGARIVDQMLDLLAMAVSDAAPRMPVAGDVRRTALLHHARTYIDRNLPDASLSLKRVAAAVGISPRYLTSLFADAGTPYRAYLRERRLWQCARDLASPCVAHRSITDIALSWGFADSAHFSRAFRARYAMSPSDFRAHRYAETAIADAARKDGAHSVMPRSDAPDA
jgi:AraC-like DNA-binding protein